MDSLNNRKSIRKYSSREVSSQLLTSLLKDAERTPTMGNLQLYSVVVTRDEEMKAKLAPAHFNQPMVTGAPVVLTTSAAPPFGRKTARPTQATTISLVSSTPPPTRCSSARPSAISRRKRGWAHASLALRYIFHNSSSTRLNCQGSPSPWRPSRSAGPMRTLPKATACPWRR